MYYHNKHRLIQSDEKVTGGKTGYTKNAKRTLVTSFKQEDFEIVVVTFNCSDDWNVHEGLANYCFDKYKQKEYYQNLMCCFMLLSIKVISLRMRNFWCRLGKVKQ